VRKIVDGLRNDVEVARARETTLEQSLDELERKASSQSRQSVELRQLERDAEASRLVYQNFLSRFKETSEQEDLQEPDARIISEAEPPLSPSEPNRQRVVLLGGAFGLMLGLGLVFLLEQLSNTFRTAADLEEQGGLPVLARIPRVWRRMRRSKVIDYARRKPNSALAEGIRNLRTAVFLANLDHPPKAVMITSSFPGEGKSTTALLLAWMSNQIGKSAIIVDCDVRRPTLYKTLGLEDVPDILSVLDGSVPLDEAIRTDEAYGLHVLPAIRTVPHAPDVLSSRRFGELIDELRARYDFVLLDAPPILSVSDAGVVGKVADATVYMVRWDATPRRAVLDGVKRLQDLRIRVTGTAMTLVDRKREAQYESYHYGYGYYAKRDAYYAD
jgi:capsular exopolysaccharide synthesis family protein